MSLRHKFDLIIPPQEVEGRPHCLQEIADGDAGAFSWLYKNYCKRLYEYCYLLTGDAALSEDLVQDLFCKLWTNREGLRQVARFTPYLYRAAKNRVLNHWAQQKSEQAKKAAYGRGLREGCAYNLFEDREGAKVLEEAVRSLAPRQQQVFRLSRELGLKRGQISAALEISPLTVKCTMQNALAHLKRRLREGEV